MDSSLAPSNILAALALLVAVAAAVYARISAQAARSGNKISLHQPRKDIYDGLLEFRRLFRGMDAHPTDEEIDAFYIKAVAPSQIYLHPDIAARIHSIYERSWELYRLIEIAESGDQPELSKWDYINPFQEVGRTELEEVIRAVTREIHVGSS
jgi:hypothetical protein